MSKTNKELAIDVALAAINANPKMATGSNNASISYGIDTTSICNIIESVNATLQKIDNDTK